MIIQYDITSSAWTVISTAGQSGTCWLDEDGDSEAGAVNIRVYHKAGAVPTADKVTEGKRVYKPAGNADVVILTADGGTDIFYARAISSGDTAKLSVDVV